MDSFDVQRLTEVDFEALCQDLLGEVYGVRFETFAQGRDGGIDLRHTDPAGNIWVVQCKHLWRSGRSALIGQIKNLEKFKVRKIKPDRYILATSVDLTPGNKDALANELKPYLLNTGDIWGITEIKEGLRVRDFIVRRHMRLWLNSQAVLQAVLNYSTIMRSSLLAEDIEETLRTYAPNESFARTAALIEEKHVCIVAGMPGIGKTTLARVLAASYVGHGYELVDISRDIEEAMSAWVDDRPQLFYYDDFLGQAALDDKLGKNEEVRLITFLRKVQRSDNKRFVLTTREYILEQARQRYEKLASTDFDPLTCIIDIGDYDDLARAHIVYNHLYFAELEQKHLVDFFEPDKQRMVIQHPNFSPRLIALTIDHFKNGMEVSGSLFLALRYTLDHPLELWDHIIRRQLNEHQLTLLETLYCLPSAKIEHVRTAWLPHAQQRGLTASNSDFDAALQVLNGTLIRLAGDNSFQQLSFSNPSIRDYLNTYIASRTDVLQAIIHGAVFFEQLHTVWTAFRASARIPSSSNSSWHSFMEKFREFFGRRLVSLLDADPPAGSLVSVRAERYTTLLHIAEFMGLDELAVEVFTRLADDSLSVTECDSLDSLVSLLETVAGFDNPNLPLALDELQAAALEQLGPAVVDSIVYSAADWNSAKEAQQALLSLDEFHRVEEEAVRQVEEVMRTSADQLIEAWQRGDKAARARTDIEEVLDFADVHIPPSRSAESLSAVDAIRNYFDLVGDHPYFTPQQSRPPTTQDAGRWSEVAQLFARLQREVIRDSPTAEVSDSAGDLDPTADRE